MPTAGGSAEPRGLVTALAEQLEPVDEGSRADAPVEFTRDAWMMLAAALVIVGDPVAAERPFTQMLRVSPGFGLPVRVEAGFPELAPATRDGGTPSRRQKNRQKRRHGWNGQARSGCSRAMMPA